MYLGNDGMDLADVVARLQTASQSNPDRRIFVRGDKSVAYGRIIEVMVTIRQGGFSKVSLLVEQTGGGPGDTTPAMAAPHRRAGAGAGGSAADDRRAHPPALRTAGLRA